MTKKKSEQVADVTKADPADPTDIAAQANNVDLGDGFVEGEGFAAMPEVQRTKINRGSTRRIAKAVAAFEAAMDTFIKEMDHQFFIADDDGNRIMAWPMVADLTEMKVGVSKMVNGALYPDAE
jgi:hypothetical protein